MVEDRALTRELLRQLSKREALLNEGDSVLIQPEIEGMQVENPLIVAGYDHDQIDAHLRLLIQRGLVDTGGVIGGALVGIYFSRLTSVGRQVLREAAD